MKPQRKPDLRKVARYHSPHQPYDLDKPEVDWLNNRRPKVKHNIGWLVGLGWALFVAFDLALTVGIAYVAIHFLSKFW